MAEMLTYSCCFDIIKNKERHVNDMKSIIGDNGNNVIHIYAFDIAIVQ